MRVVLRQLLLGVKEYKDVLMKYCVVLNITFKEHETEEQEDLLIDSIIDKVEPLCGVDSEFQSVILSYKTGSVIFAMDEFTSHQVRRFCDELKQIPDVINVKLDKIKLN